MPSNFFKVLFRGFMGLLKKNQHKSETDLHWFFFEFLRGNFSMQPVCCELLCSKKYLKFLVFIFDNKDSRFIWNNEREKSFFQSD